MNLLVSLYYGYGSIVFTNDSRPTTNDQSSGTVTNTRKGWWEQ